jgi:hypothetical protein
LAFADERLEPRATTSGGSFPAKCDGDCGENSALATCDNIHESSPVILDAKHSLPLWPIIKLICGPNVKVRNLWHMNWCISMDSMIPLSATT